VVPPWQVIKQPPQFLGFVRTLVSHPLEKTASQSPHPKLQLSTQQSPLEQKAVAFVREQTLPQAPQFLGSFRRLVQTPPQEVIGGWQVTWQDAVKGTISKDKEKLAEINKVILGMRPLKDTILYPLVRFTYIREYGFNTTKERIMESDFFSGSLWIGQENSGGQEGRGNRDRGKCCHCSSGFEEWPWRSNFIG
jgi:hypothetical protein